MSNNNFKSSSVTDSEILDEILFYLTDLFSLLPVSRLQHHCLGAVASIFELLYFLKSQNLKDYSDYGDYKK